MTPEQKHYYAFVSHSSRDAKIALWLRDKLVNYNIPASIRKENQMPKRLRPVFIYQTDLAGANLQDALQRELEDSQWLIVICSPDGAKSQYVNGEVEHFINTGRANRIIPFIVGGTPHAKNPEDECFPPALLKLAEDGIELRGVNLAECQKQLGSKMGAVVNVVATMLGVRFDSMWNVYQRKQRRQLFVAAAIAALFCLAGFFAWDYWRPRYEYFADYVDKWGVPEGVIKLTKEQKSHRNRMYRFEYRRIPFGEPNAWQWRVVKVMYVNSVDIPHEDNFFTAEHYLLTTGKRTTILRITYDKQDGSVSQQIYCDGIGKILLRHSLSERNGVKAAIADFVNAQESQGVGYVGLAERPTRVTSKLPNIVRYAYERDANGYITKLTFHANNDYNLARSATRDAQGIYGYVFSRDTLGRCIQILFVDKDGQCCASKYGVAGQRIEYDSYGNIRQLAYLDLNGTPVINDRYGFAIIALSTDSNGNLSEFRYLSPQGEPSINEHMGFERITMQYDNRGNEIECAYFEAGDTPFEDDWFGHKCIKKYDKKGQCIEKTFYGKDGRLYLPESGFATLGAKNIYKYDKQGNCIEKAAYGLDGQLYGGKDGIAIERFVFDKDGNDIEWTFYDQEGKPRKCDAGYAKSTTKYDEHGRVIEWAFYDENYKPCMRDADNVAKWCKKYDDRGNEIERSFYDTEGNPCISSKMLCATARVTYDDNGHPIEASHYGADGKPCIRLYGYSVSKTDYDNHGNEIEIRYYDTNGNLCNRDEGYARVTAEYNDYNELIAKHYYDKDGKEVQVAEN